MPTTGLKSAKTSMLCRRCHSLLDIVSKNDQVSDSTNHSSFHDLKASAGSGCRLCLLISTYLSDESEKHAELLNAFVDIDTTSTHDDRRTLNCWFADPREDEAIPSGERKYSDYVYINVDQVATRLDHTVLSDCTGSDQSIECVRRWLQRCDTYTTCAQWRSINKVARSLPKRLVYIGKSPEYSDLKILCADDLPLIGAAYATLSHCWGGKCWTKLLRNNLDEFRSRLPWSALSKTFREAITVTRRLDIRYLWIDALCILQDSEEDWNLAASTMDQVYSNSYLNLSATASTDGEGGLFRRRDPLNVQTLVVSVDDLSSLSKRFLCYRNSWFDDIERGPVNERAWVVQERWLAPRVVHFGESQLHWECESCMTSENLSDRNLPLERTVAFKALPYDALANNTSQKQVKDVYYFWFRIVVAYTHSRLTFEADRPFAIQGLVWTIRHHLGLEIHDYIFGLWRPIFIDCLVWSTATDTRRAERSQTKQAPTWSWLSINGPISHFVSIYVSIVRLTSVVDLPAAVEVIVQPDTTNKAVRLRGPLCKAMLMIGETKTGRERSGDNYYTPAFLRLRLVEDFLEEFESFYLLWDDHRDDVIEQSLQGDLFLLLARTHPGTDPLWAVNSVRGGCNVGEYECLLLAPDSSNEGHFKRVGHIRFRAWLKELPDFLAEISESLRQDMVLRTDEIFRVLNEHFRSDDVPAHLYDHVDNDFMYTFTLS